MGATDESNVSHYCSGDMFVYKEVRTGEISPVRADVSNLV